MFRKAVDVLFWLSASLYFGGMIVVGAVVAPAVFDTTKGAEIVLPGFTGLEGTRQAGGEIFGSILYRFAYVEYAALGVLFLCLAIWLATTRFFRRSTWVMAVLWAIVLALTVYDSASLTPRVWAQRTVVRSELTAHAAEEDVVTPARAEFDALHKRSEMIGHVKAYALLAMVVIGAWRGSPYRRRGGTMLNEAMRSSRR
jgi:hypothetical protein